MKKPERPFKTFQQFNKCAKAFALLIVYHNPNSDEASSDFIQAVFNYAEKELNKMNLPEGWREHSGTYNEWVEFYTANT